MIRRLTEEEASHYFTIKELDIDLSKGENWKFVKGFYNIPSLDPPDDREWEDVIYVSKRKKKVYYNGEGSYYIYILSNPVMPDIFKIGYTKYHPEKRATQISRSTGVPLPYKVEYAFKCHDGELLEKEIHRHLDYCRVNSDREYFNIPLEEAQIIIEKLGKKYNNEISNSK